MEAEGGIGELVQELLSSNDPRRQLWATVRLFRQLFERGQDVIEISAACRSDPEVESFWREGEACRRNEQARWVRAWVEAGALPSGLSEEEAADVLWELTGPDVYNLFVVGCGWSASKFEMWLFDALESQLFGTAAPGTL